MYLYQIFKLNLLHRREKLDLKPLLSNVNVGMHNVTCKDLLWKHLTKKLVFGTKTKVEKEQQESTEGKSIMF